MSELMTMVMPIFSAFLRKNISLSLVIFAILLGRILLKKLPKRYSYFLWTGLGIKALFDLKLPSLLKVFANKADTIKKIDSVVTTGQKYVIKYSESTPAGSAGTASVREMVFFVLFLVWIAGVVYMTARGIVEFVKIKKKTAASIKEDSGLYRCDYIESPMAFGFVKPKIYIPSNFNTDSMQAVIEHEKYHIKRGDIYFKLLAFILLCAYWMNPLSWISFKLFNLDMELSCDEAVLRKTGFGSKKDYSKWLLYYSSAEHTVGLAPTAFGETDTKRRVKNIMRFKKKGLLATLLGVVTVAAVLIVCFLVLPNLDAEAAMADTTAKDQVVTQETIAAEVTKTDSAVNEIVEEVKEEIRKTAEAKEPETVTLTWQKPLPEDAPALLTGPFGGTTLTGLYHAGVDIAAPKGTDVLAMADGTVIEAGLRQDTGEGNVVVIRVNDEITYTYTHLEGVNVKIGDTVKAGDVVASVGSTGNSTGPHLHVEICVNGENIDMHSLEGLEGAYCTPEPIDNGSADPEELYHGKE